MRRPPSRPPWQAGRMRLHTPDAIAFDHDIHVGCGRSGSCRPPGARRERRCGPSESSACISGRAEFHFAGLDVDGFQLVHRLIQDALRVAEPARRVRAFRGDMPRRAQRLARSSKPAIPRARLHRSRPSWCRPATTPDRSRRANRSKESAPARTTCTLPPSADIVRTWLVPSRKRLESGATIAIATIACRPATRSAFRARTSSRESS